MIPPILTKDANGIPCWEVTCGAEVDGDGSPRCYGPDDTGLDFTANGGPMDAPYGYELNPTTGLPFIQGNDAPVYGASRVPGVPPYVIDTTGFYVSTTTYQREAFPANDPCRYLNAETEVFIVVPGWFRRQVSGVVIGCRASVEYRDKIISGIAGDVGPSFGELSIAAAKALGIPSSPRNGGVESGVTFRVYPGMSVYGFDLQSA